MAPGLDSEIEALVRAGSIAPAGQRALEVYGAELFGFLKSLVNASQVEQVFAQVTQDLEARLPTFSFWCNLRTLLYRIARAALQLRPFVADEVAIARTAPHRGQPAADRVSVLRDSLELDDRILLTLRIDRELTWEEVAGVMIEAEAPDAATLTRETERVRERFMLLKSELRQRAQYAQGSVPTASLDAGDTADLVDKVIGSYRIIDLVGGGGMGVVWRAEHVTLGRKAVIKFIHDELDSDPAHAKRFLVEAKTAASIRHPGIVEVFDYTTDDRGRAYIAMEFLEGESLRERLEREHPLSIDLALAVTVQTAAAVAAAHAAGVIHRDLKPDNLFLVPNRESPHGLRVKVLDFGLAKVTTTGEPGVTKTGSIVGTPRYMSPEQCRDHAVIDPRADIYTLGCILYEMVCGRVPFLDATVGDLIIAHSTLPPPVPSSLSSAISPALDRAILRALAKRPEERFATMDDFGSALAQLAGTAPANALADTAVARPPRPMAEPAPAKRRVGVIIAIAVVAVAIILVLARC